VLSINPTDLIARTLRLLLFRNMAVDAEIIQCPWVFLRCLKKKPYLSRKTVLTNPKIFFVNMQLFISPAMLTLRYTRSDKNIAADRKTLCRLKQNVFDAWIALKTFLKKA